MTNLAATSSPENRNWNKQLSKLKDKYSILINEDVHYTDGKKDIMLIKLQIKLNITKEELASIIMAL
jgi:hypothetical protein